MFQLQSLISTTIIKQIINVREPLVFQTQAALIRMVSCDTPVCPSVCVCLTIFVCVLVSACLYSRQNE